MPAWQGWCKYCWSCSCYTTWANTITNTNGEHTDLNKDINENGYQNVLYSTVDIAHTVLPSYLSACVFVGNGIDVWVHNVHIATGHCLLTWPLSNEAKNSANVSSSDIKRGGWLQNWPVWGRNFWFSWPVSNCLSLKILFSIDPNETMLIICSEGWAIMQEQRNNESVWI